MTTAQEIVREIAKESPIVQDGEINVCKFCGQTWAESAFGDYLTREAQRNDGKHKDTWTANRLRWEHHTGDCVWVRANKICSEVT